ncbi:MAG: hypothetical protein ACI9VS_002191 [Candidatus Binatia bacterium]
MDFHKTGGAKAAVKLSREICHARFFETPARRFAGGHAALKSGAASGAGDFGWFSHVAVDVCPIIV